MIITKKQSFTREEIKKLSAEFETYIKTVIDINKKICSAGANLHFENEQILLKQSSDQSDLWGGGIDLETMMIDNNAVINLRPNDNNFSNEIQDPKNRQTFEKLMKFFFCQLDPSWKK